MIFRILYSLILILVAGCSFISDEKNKVVVAPLPQITGNSVTLDTVWTKNVGSQGDQNLNLVLTPAIQGGYIYTASASGRVISLDRFSGKVVWSTSVSAQISSAVAAGDGLVVVSDLRGRVIALDALTGSQKWEAFASSEVLAAPAISSGAVIVQSIDSVVRAFDANTGAQKWNFTATQAVLTLRGNSSPLIHNDTVFAAFDNGKVVAIDLETGLLKWEQRFVIPNGRSELERVIDVQATPILSESELIVGAYQSAIVSLDPSTGRPNWEVKGSVAQNMYESAGSVYVVESQDIVRGIRLGSGREAWKYESMTNRKLSSVAALGSYVAVADSEGYVHLLDSLDGSYVGRRSVGDSVRGTILSDGTILYVLNSDGKLTALKIREN